VILHFSSTEALQDFRANNTDKSYSYDEASLFVVIPSAPLLFGYNSVNFAPVDVRLISEDLATTIAPTNGTARIMKVSPTNGMRRYESWVEWVWASATASSKPEALLAYGGPYDAGGYQSNRLREFDLPGVTCPIVHMIEADGLALLIALQKGGGEVNITVTDSPSNPYWDRRNGIAYVIMSALLILISIAVITIASAALYFRGIRRNIPTLCLLLDITAAITRILFAIDPFADRFFPSSVTEIFFTAFVAMFVSSTVLIAMFWHELATQASMQITGGLTKLKIPAIIVILLLFVLEIVSSAIRAAKLKEVDVVQQVNAIYYVIVIILMISYYSYVAWKVFQFLRSKDVLRKNDKILRDVRTLGRLRNVSQTNSDSRFPLSSFQSERLRLFWDCLCF
jgi:hypothetical protein